MGRARDRGRALGRLAVSQRASAAAGQAGRWWWLDQGCWAAGGRGRGGGRGGGLGGGGGGSLCVGEGDLGVGEAGEVDLAGGADEGLDVVVDVPDVDVHAGDDRT